MQTPREARLRHEALCDQLEARDQSDITDLLLAHMGGYIDLRKPAPYMPGSREKRAILSARYRLGIQQIFVPGDRS